jgi:hypothetical protein
MMDLLRWIVIETRPFFWNTHATDHPSSLLSSFEKSRRASEFGQFFASKCEKGDNWRITCAFTSQYLWRLKSSLFLWSPTLIWMNSSKKNSVKKRAVAVLPSLSEWSARVFSWNHSIDFLPWNHNTRKGSANIETALLRIHESESINLWRLPYRLKNTRWYWHRSIKKSRKQTTHNHNELSHMDWSTHQ